MNILLVFCKLDLASVNFYNVLKNNYKIKENQLETDGQNKIYICELEKMHIFLKEEELSSVVCNYSKIDLVVFMSKHSTLSEVKPRSITVHAIGNWGKAELGGKDETLVKTDPILIRSLLLELYSQKPKTIEYEIKQEATHHGPFLEKFTIFVEIGSDENAWKDEVVSKFVLDNVILVLNSYDKEKAKTAKEWKEAVGVGGSHYCTKFNRLTFDKEQKYCFGHIIPDYALKNIKNLEEMITQAKEKSNASLVLDESLKEITF